MLEITIGDKQVRLRATPLALLFYRQEFNSDLVGDLVSFQAVTEDMTQFDSVVFLQLVWAMAKADKPQGFPSFEAWLAELDAFDFSDEETMLAVMEEAMDGFFRRANRSQRR